jgi:ABC-type molybdate transport system substrate-binding protein
MALNALRLALSWSSKVPFGNDATLLLELSWMQGTTKASVHLSFGVSEIGRTSLSHQTLQKRQEIQVFGP